MGHYTLAVHYKVQGKNNKLVVHYKLAAHNKVQVWNNRSSIHYKLAIHYRSPFLITPSNAQPTPLALDKKFQKSQQGTLGFLFSREKTV